jgi:O-antigen ligase
LAVIVTLAYAFVLHEQVAARPWIASPHPVWRESAEALGIPIEPSTSIVRNAPLLALGAPLANMLVAICSFIICIDRDRARQLLLVVAWSGVAYAVFGMAAYFDPSHTLWPERPDRHFVTSTFLYRSTAAVYFGSCAVLWLLFVMQHLRQRLPLDSFYWKSARSLLLSEMPLLSLVMLLICLVAMLMTRSRAGILLSFVALTLAFFGFFYRDLLRRRWFAAALVIGGLTAFALLETMGADVAERFATEGFVDQGRLDVYRSMLRMSVDHPWFGTGLGTFVWGFPAYRSDFSMWGIWEFAHSTPLELAADVGIPLTGLIGLAWLVVLVVLMRGVRTRRNDRMVPAGALAVAILCLTHSFIDFSPQNPGYAFVVFSLVGAGLAQSFSNNNPNRIRKGRA